MTWAEDYICKLSSEIHSVLNCADDYEELITQLESLAAVSYTHLDVYKRQG